MAIAVSQVPAVVIEFECGQTFPPWSSLARRWNAHDIGEFVDKPVNRIRSDDQGVIVRPVSLPDHQITVCIPIDRRLPLLGESHALGGAQPNSFGASSAILDRTTAGKDLRFLISDASTGFRSPPPPFKAKASSLFVLSPGFTNGVFFIHCAVKLPLQKSSSIIAHTLALGPFMARPHRAATRSIRRQCARAGAAGLRELGRQSRQHAHDTAN